MEEEGIGVILGGVIGWFEIGEKGAYRRILSVFGEFVVCGC